MKVDICLPVYNEEKILGKNVLRLLRFCEAQRFDFDWNVVIVVNGSNDASETIAKKLAAENPRIVACVMPKPGRGRALRERWLASDADIIAYMDMDLSVALDCLPDLLTPIIQGTADVAFGSRLRPGATVQRSMGREIVSRTYNQLAKFLVPHPYSDLQCGFKAVRQTTFVTLSPHILNPGWFFDTELIIWAHRLGYQVAEIPVNWQQSRFGPRPSTVRIWGDTIRFLRQLFGLRKELKQWGRKNEL